MRLYKSICAALLAIAALMPAYAQNSVMSPYSRYGYGLLNDNVTSAQRAMGGVGYAMCSGRQINVMNPASYAAIDSLTFLFDMGADLNMLWSQENSVKEDNISGGLDYITMAFPISRRIGVSVGMLPFSSTGYSFSSEIVNGTSSHIGSGDINQIYAGVGINPFAGLHVGANVAYLFGSTYNDVYVNNDQGTSSLFERYMRVRDYRVDIGVEYPVNFGKGHRVTLGATFSPGKSLHGETFGLYYDATLDSKADTIGYTDLKGKYTMPYTLGAGINYNWRDRLMVEADFTWQPWSKAKYAAIQDFEDTSFANRWKAALGVQYTPYARGSYLQRVQYRAGLYYNHDYLTVRGNNVREYGITAGFGLPVPMFKTIVNIGLEYKHRQAHPNPLVKEQYFNITLGINFNEMWFRNFKLH